MERYIHYWLAFRSRTKPSCVLLRTGSFFRPLLVSQSCVFCAIASQVWVNTSARTIYSPCFNSVHWISVFIQTHAAKGWLIPQMPSHTNTFSYSFTGFSPTTRTYLHTFTIPLCFLLIAQMCCVMACAGYYQWPCGMWPWPCVSLVLDKRSVPLHRMRSAQDVCSTPCLLLITFSLAPFAAFELRINSATWKVFRKLLCYFPLSYTYE